MSITLTNVNAQAEFRGWPFPLNQTPKNGHNIFLTYLKEKIMNIMKLKTAARNAAAIVAVAAMSAPAMADTNLLDTASTEIGALKTGIIAFGAVVVGLAVVIATISVAKRVINKA